MQELQGVVKRKIDAKREGLRQRGQRETRKNNGL